MNMIYLARKGDGTVVFHADKKAMYDLDNLEPELAVTLADFENAGGLARVIDGEIFLGKTADEIAEEERLAQINAYKAELAELDKEAGAGRSVRDISMSLAEQNGITGDAYRTIKGIENRADIVRGKLHQLLA